MLVAVIVLQPVMVAWWAAGGRLLLQLQLVNSFITLAVFAMFFGASTGTWTRLRLLLLPAVLAGE
jgi:hypothetical protein